MKDKKKEVSFLFESNHRQEYTRGMGLVSVTEDEVNLNKRSSKMNSFRSMDLNESDFYMDSESSEIRNGPKYREFEDQE